MSSAPLLSVVLPVLDIDPELPALTARLHEFLRAIDPGGELILSGFGVSRMLSSMPGLALVRTIDVQDPGFGPAMRAGLQAARGDYVLTLDAHAAQPDEVARDLWQNRARGEIVVASRYVAGARVGMSVPRRIASRVLNRVFGRGLSLPVTDLSSAFRLYRGDVLRQQRLDAVDYDLLPELLVRALAAGWRVAEITLRTQ
jgi:glycosyltransferase involved in cell wall biosynthesis